MKNRVVCLCAIIFSFIVVPVFSQVTNLSQTEHGIWQAFGDPVSASINPELRGRLCKFSWADIEPSSDQWSWTSFDAELKLRTADKLPVIFMVFTEEDAPEWLYSNGVPKVEQRDNKGNIVAYGPFYKDEDYKFYFKRMIRKVREHVETLPAEIRNQLLAVQGCFGSTGDYISYKGDVDFQYRIGNGEFYALFQEFSQAYFDEYKNTNPKIYLLSNPKNDGPDQAAWLVKNCPGGWIKTGTLGKGYQLNDEKSKYNWLYPMINTPIFNGEYIRTRSEIIGGTTSSGWWKSAPAKNMYALMCYDIFWGLDWSNQGYEQINDKLYDSAFGFYNKYAGKKDPAQSAYAMCALKDGLDASDNIRFPGGTYGAVSRGNTNRYIAIANEFAARGAKLEDLSNVKSDEIGNLSAKGINDVGWDIFPGNYERYLHQIKPNETSVGYWNVQSADKNDMYGRFARGFDLSKGKDALYFNVEDAFFNNAPLNSKQPVVVEIIYFDNSYGSWQLFYDGSGNTDKPSMLVNGTGSKLWKRASITIHDAYFGNRAINGADFYIKNTGSENVIFSTVELRRPQAGEVTGLSASKLAPFSTACAGGASFQVLYVAGSFLPGGSTVVGPLKGFAFSIDSGKTYPDSVIIKDHGAVFSKKIFVKFKPDHLGVYSGDIPVRSDNVASITIPVEASSENSSPALQQVVKSASCSDNKDGAIDLVCNGGIGPFTYTWSGPSNFKAYTEDVNSLSAGTYMVTVNSLGGCITKDTVLVSSPNALQAGAAATQIPLGQNTTNVTVVASGGTSPYLGVGNFTVGEGTYTYTVTDANGCHANTTVTVSKTQGGLTASANAQDISCHGGFTTVTVTASGGTAPYTGTGDFVVSAGTYTYSVTDADGSASSVTITVNEPTALNAVITAENILCNGGTANIDVAGSGGVAPYTGTGNFTVVSGIHTYTISDANGCTAVKTINVTEPAKLNISVSSASVLCNGGTAAVNVSANGGITPYTGTGNFSVPAGNYTYTVTDVNGCKDATVIEITEPEALNVSVKAEPLAPGQNTTTVAVSATGGVAPYTGTGNFTVAQGVYNYTVTDANSCQAGSSVNVSSIQLAQLTASASSGNILCNGGTTTVTISATGGLSPYTGTGVYMVTAGTYNYTVTDALGNTCKTSITVTEPAVLTINSVSKADDAACRGESSAILINTTGGTMPYQYNLNAGPYQSSNEFSKLSDGNYTIIVKDNNGCLSSAPAVVTKTAPMAAWFSEINDVSTCGFADGSVTVINQGGIGPFEYSINSGDFQSANVFTKLPESEYTVSVRDSRGCQTSALTTIGRNSELKLTITGKLPVSGCNTADGAITVSASGGGGSYQYCINGEAFKGVSSFTGLPEGEYTITVKDWRGCTKAVTTTIEKIPALVASIQSITNAGACTNDGALKVGLTGGSAPYLYSINGGLAQASDIFTNLSAGIYTVKITDGRGCIASVIATISKAQQMLISADTTGISCKGGADGTITISNTGGLAPYEYSVDDKPFGSRNIFGNLKAGLHTITVKDSKGCTAVLNIRMADGTENCETTLPTIFNPDDSLFKIVVLPNPSPTAFTLVTNGSSTERIEIHVADMTGRIVYKTSGSASQEYRFGNEFAAGMYIVRIIKGVHVEYVKIIKTRGQ